MIIKMTRIRKDILNGRIGEQLLIFFIPVLLTYVLNQLYNTVDAMIVGKYVGTEALAAVGGSTGTSIGLITNFILGLSSGVTVIVAQYYGRGDEDGVSRAVKTGFFIAVVFGFIMTLVSLIFVPHMLKLLGVPDDMFPLSKIYMSTFLLGLIPNLIYNVGASILRAIGDSKRPLYFLAVCALVNVFVDYLFVAKLSLGVFGAALATVIAQVVSALLVITVFMNSDDCIRFHIRDFGYDRDLLKKTVAIGFPSGIQTVVYSISNLYIQSCVNSFGTATIAAYTALDKIDGFFWNFSGALGVAISTIAGQNFGAGNIERVHKTVRISSLMYAIGTSIFFTFSYFGAETLNGLFSSDTEVIAVATSLVRYLAPRWILFLCIEVLSSTMKACGDVVMPMFISIIGIAVTRIIYLTFVPFTDVIGAMRCYPISWIITSVAFIIYYFKGSWSQRSRL